METLLAGSGNDLKSLLEEAFLLGLFGLHILLMKQSRRDSTGLTLTINWYVLNFVTAPLLGYYFLFNLARFPLPTIRDISPWMFHGPVFIYGLCWAVGALKIALFLFLAESFIHLEKVGGKWRVVLRKSNQDDDAIVVTAKRVE